MKIIFWGAILTVISNSPMANESINNQVFIFSCVVSEVVGGGGQYCMDKVTR